MKQNWSTTTKPDCLTEWFNLLTLSLARSECFWTTLEKPEAFESAMLWTITRMMMKMAKSRNEALDAHYECKKKTDRAAATAVDRTDVGKPPRVCSREGTTRLVSSSARVAILWVPLRCAPCSREFPEKYTVVAAKWMANIGRNSLSECGDASQPRLAPGDGRYSPVWRQLVEKEAARLARARINRPTRGANKWTADWPTYTTPFAAHLYMEMMYICVPYWMANIAELVVSWPRIAARSPALYHFDAVGRTCTNIINLSLCSSN